MIPGLSKASDKEARIPNPQTGILEGETWVSTVEKPGSRDLELELEQERGILVQELRSRTKELGSEIQELESLLV